MVRQVVNPILAHELNLELLTRLVEPLEILALEGEAECLVLGGRTVLDFVKLVELALEDDERAALGTLQVDVLILILLERVNHLVEVLILKEKPIIFRLDFQHELLQRDSVSILIEILLQRRVLIFLQPVY